MSKEIGRGTHLELDVGELAHLGQIPFSSFNDTIGQLHRVLHPSARCGHVGIRIEFGPFRYPIHSDSLLTFRIDLEPCPFVTFFFAPVLSVFYLVKNRDCFTHFLMTISSFSLAARFATFLGCGRSVDVEDALG